MNYGMNFRNGLKNTSIISIISYLIKVIILFLLFRAHELTGDRIDRSLKDLFYWPDGVCVDMLITYSTLCVCILLLLDEILFWVKCNTKVRRTSGSKKRKKQPRTNEMRRAEQIVDQNDLNDEFDYEQRAKQYIPTEPKYSFERVILPQDIMDTIREAVGMCECANKVFEEWGVYEIQPNPATAINFWGPPGTGKTMAAEAIAGKLGKKIMKVSYADVVSKYHGEGTKMMKAVFKAASNADAVLFFDEADSLLAKRLTDITQAAEQAINSMRSQLLICLEEFRGIVIFATNLVENYDQAFLNRMINVEFKMPDAATRKAIWDVHITSPVDGKRHQLNIPLGRNVDTKELSEKYEIVGREIRNAVVSACISAASAGKNMVAQEDLISACEKIVQEKKSLAKVKGSTVWKGDCLEWIR